MHTHVMMACRYVPLSLALFSFPFVPCPRVSCHPTPVFFTDSLTCQTDDLQGHIIICGFGRVGQVCTVRGVTTAWSIWRGPCYLWLWPVGRMHSLSTILKL